MVQQKIPAIFRRWPSLLFPALIPKCQSQQSVRAKRLLRRRAKSLLDRLQHQERLNRKAITYRKTLKSLQSAAPGANGHEPFLHFFPERFEFFAVPNIIEGLLVDIAAGIVLVVAAWRHAAVGGDFRDEINAFAFGIAAVPRMVAVVTAYLRFRGYIGQKLRHRRMALRHAGYFSDLPGGFMRVNVVEARF